MNYLWNVNKIFVYILSFLSFVNFNSFAQGLIIKGKITNSKYYGIENASISVFDQQKKNLGYAFSDKEGIYSISIKLNSQDSVEIEVSCLGFRKLLKLINIYANIQNFTLIEKYDILTEVVIESGKKIKVNQDTTFIRVESFSNKTEQTVEDILKKLPGIVIRKDGTITAHGKIIDKLLIEGEDIFDANYKILTKNLDAKVLEEVQIIDNFEDNPIFKKLNNSDKVALNLKLKKGYSNVWFGNITLGGSISKNSRWKESLTLGLLKKKIKGFYFGDFNNLGEKSTDLFSTNVNNKNNYSNDRLEYKAKSLYSITNNEILFFSKTQSVFNDALLNSLSFSSNLTKRVSLRGLVYVGYDNQNQNSLTTTKYNLVSNPVTFTEKNNYVNKKILSSSEIEIKFKANEKNYFTNLFVIKNNPSNTFNNLLFNNSNVVQNLNNENLTFYNHLNHTIRISDKAVLNNYFYIGNDKIQEKLTILSPPLNSYLGIDTFSSIRQNVNNKLFFFGIKSKLVTKSKKIDLTNSIQIEHTNESFENSFFSRDTTFIDYQNNTKIKIGNISQENTLRYNFNKKIDLTARYSLKQSKFNFNNRTKNIFNTNPSIYFNIKKTRIGNFTLSYLENNAIPEINQLTTNYYLSDFRSFLLGTSYSNLLRNKTTALNYYFYNDEKRYSLNVSSYYSTSKSIINSINKITNDFNFNNYIQSSGGISYNLSVSMVNYLRKLKTATKIENISTWIDKPINANSNSFLQYKGFTNYLKYSGTTYFKRKINLDFSISFNYFQSIYQEIKAKNSTFEGFLNINYKINKTLLLESNNSIYVVNKQKYFFNNAILNYNPIESKLSFRVIFNNIINENKYKNVTINEYAINQYTVQLVPRYLLVTMKYRF